MPFSKLLIALMTLLCLFFTSCTEEIPNENHSENNEYDSLVIQETSEMDDSFYAQENEYHHFVYSAEEWLAKGYLDFPFDLDDYSFRDDKERFSEYEIIWEGQTFIKSDVEIYEAARYQVPEEALKQASTIDLLLLVFEYRKSSPLFYNFPSHYIDYISESFNVVDEMFQRDDFAEVLLQTYIESEFMPALSFETYEEQYEYDVKRSRQEAAIVAMEIFLARNDTFDQMNDEMRRRTLEAVFEKYEFQQIEEFKHTGMYSQGGFFAYLKELQYFDGHFLVNEESGERIEQHPEGSKWYNYIYQTFHDEDLEKCLFFLQNNNYYLP